VINSFALEIHAGIDQDNPSDVDRPVELPNTCGVLKESAWLPSPIQVVKTFAGGKYHSDAVEFSLTKASCLPGAGRGR